VQRLPIELGLALRYLRPKRTFVSVITLLCILGVAIGVAVLIIVISVMSGFHRELREKLIGFEAHLKVGKIGSPVLDWESVADQVRAHPAVRGVAPFIQGQVLLQTQPDHPGMGTQSAAPYVRGLDAVLEAEVSVLTTSVIDGDFDLGGQGLVVGSTLAYNLDLHVGDTVAVYTTRAIDQMLASMKRGDPEVRVAENFKVQGIFQVGFDQIDATFVGISLWNAQDMFALGDAVSGLTVMLHNSEPGHTYGVQRELEEMLGLDYRTISWMESNGELLGAVEVEKDVMLIILFFVMVVAAFCIICSQIAFVVRKTRDIGILKGLGATHGQVISVFLLQSFSVGCLGVLAGLGAGLFGVAVRNEFLMAMRKVTGRELFPQAIYHFSSLPALVLPGDLILICGLSLAMCLVAGVVPAWIAASLKPVDALRNE
jgi:lipoprotein-releasing system permease protein